MGHRVVRVEVLGPERYDPLDLDKTYRVACDSFICTGGDDFTMLKGKAVASEDHGYPIRDVVEQYIADRSPIRAKVEGRIKK